MKTSFKIKEMLDANFSENFKLIQTGFDKNY